MPDRSAEREHWRYVAGCGVAFFVLSAMFPRTARRLRWPARLGPRGLAAYVLVNTAFQFALRAWLVPWLDRELARAEQIKAELRGQLGREPTDDELVAGVTKARATRAAA